MNSKLGFNYHNLPIMAALGMAPKTRLSSWCADRLSDNT